MRFLMCPPTFYGIHYEINPWMSLKIGAAPDLAEREWKQLYHTLLDLGAQIDLIEPIDGLPDMVFTANAGLYLQNKIILPNFKYFERKGERPYFRDWFHEHQFNVLNEDVDPLLSFEGAGDALLAGNKLLFAGYGFRTDRSFYQTMAIFKDFEVIECELVDPYFYHIDTCFCPLNEHSAIWYKNAFSKTSQQAMQNHIKLIDVSRDDARQFGCNSVVIENHIIIPSGCDQLKQTLNAEGLQVLTCNMSEFIKAGGACKCLTLRID